MEEEHSIKILLLHRNNVRIYSTDSGLLIIQMKFQLKVYVESHVSNATKHRTSRIRDFTKYDSKCCQIVRIMNGNVRS